MTDTGIAVLVVVVGISILIFLALREVWAWYTKTNQIIKILENQLEILQKNKHQIDVLYKILDTLQENKK